IPQVGPVESKLPESRRFLEIPQHRAAVAERTNVLGKLFPAIVRVPRNGFRGHTCVVRIGRFRVAVELVEKELPDPALVFEPRAIEARSQKPRIGLYPVPAAAELLEGNVPVEVFGVVVDCSRSRRNDLRAVLDANTPTRAALHKIECPVQHEGSLGPPVLPVVEPAKARETHLPSTRVVRYSLSRENRAHEQPG